MPRKILSVSEALSNPLRRQILSVIIERPGLSIRQLSKIIGIGVGSLAGHITILERVGLIREVRRGRRLELYVNESMLLTGGVIVE